MKPLFLLMVLTGAEVPKSPDTFYCDAIRFYVRLYGEDAAEKWAVKHKWSSQRIAESRKCLVK